MYPSTRQRHCEMNARTQRSFRPFWISAVGVLLAAVSAGGCGRGPSLAEVTGMVTYRGNPVPNASIVLQPQEGPPALGTSGGQGQFSLATGGRPGAVPGPAIIAITAYDDVRTIPAGDLDPEGLSEVRSRIPEKYALVATSPLTIEVTSSGANHFNLELTD